MPDNNIDKLQNAVSTKQPKIKNENNQWTKISNGKYKKDICTNIMQ